MPMSIDDVNKDGKFYSRCDGCDRRYHKAKDTCLFGEKKLRVLLIGVAPSHVISLKKGVIWWMTQANSDERRIRAFPIGFDQLTFLVSSWTTRGYLDQLNKSLVKDILHNARIAMSKCDNWTKWNVNKDCKFQAWWCYSVSDTGILVKKKLKKKNSKCFQ